MKKSHLASLYNQIIQVLSYKSKTLYLLGPSDICARYNPFQLPYSGLANFSSHRPTLMNAAVVHEAGGPEVFRTEKRAKPEVVFHTLRDSKPTPLIPCQKDGQVLIRVKAFGLNRSEMFTRQGHSPVSAVDFPRILGIEATGVVEDAPGSSNLKAGDIVATAMGGMGRDFDGGYAEYTVVPVEQVQVIHPNANISWDLIGALPEMMQTAWGALFTSLRLEKTDRLLIRGGTTSVGLAAAAIAKVHGAFVVATTRKPERKQSLLDNGADKVFIDDGKIVEQCKKSGTTFNKVLEMVGVDTIPDSLQCMEEGGILCEVGSVCNKWAFDKGFSAMATIPTAVSWTTYHSSVKGVMTTPLDQILDWVAAGTMKVKIGKVFNGLEHIVEAHRWMDEDRAGGKIVVVLDH